MSTRKGNFTCLGSTIFENRWSHTSKQTIFKLALVGMIFLTSLLLDSSLAEAGSNPNTTGMYSGIIPTAENDKIGSYDPDTYVWRLKAGNTWSDSVTYLQWGAPGWIPIVGDWDNDGEDEVGHYDPATGVWRLKAENTWNGAVTYLQWGASGWIPVTGDWDNDGYDEVGLYDPATGIWRLKSENTWNGAVTYLQWGSSGWTPVTGDWDNDGYDEVGHYDSATGVWRLKSDNTWNASVTYLQWGASGWEPVTGDWDDDGVGEVGFYDPSTRIWRLKSANTWDASVQYLQWGALGWTPVAGDWNIPPEPTPTPTPVPAPANIQITYIFYDGVEPSYEGDEYATITNQGSSPVNLSGWKINAGATGQDFFFPSYIMSPGESCRVYTDENHPEYCGFNFGSGLALWANSGDCGYLFDNTSTQVDSYCY